MLSNNIIAAPATAPGISSVAMIRVSGKNCIAVVDSVFSGNLSKKNPHEIAYGKIIHPQTQKIIDEVLIGVFHSPNSFTGEDSLEIWTHGSPYITKEVMSLLLSLGITTANPGEFSMRAFLNGKIDLTQAEAIKDLTHAQTKYAHAQAIASLEGGLSLKINEIHQQILNLLALLEVAIDHAEEETDVNPQYHGLVEKIIDKCDLLLAGASIGKMSVDGVKVVLIGRPNVGKSSLLNALVDEDRVIVSDIAGTTRDVIEHRISARGLLIRLFDTAGLRQTDDKLEQEGTKRSLKAIEQADIILHLMDQSQEIQEEDLKIIKDISKINKPIKTILNKSDLEPKIKQEDAILISAKNRDGIESILDFIHECYVSGGLDPEEEVFITNIRQESLIKNTRNYLIEAQQSMQIQESEEFIAAHVRKARISVEEIVGKTNSDDILDRIFSQFCIGK